MSNEVYLPLTWTFSLQFTLLFLLSPTGKVYVSVYLLLYLWTQPLSPSLPDSYRRVFHLGDINGIVQAIDFF